MAPSPDTMHAQKLMDDLKHWNKGSRKNWYVHSSMQEIASLLFSAVILSHLMQNQHNGLHYL